MSACRHNETWVVDAEPNGIMPPFPRRAMGRSGTVDSSIVHRGRGSAEVDVKVILLHIKKSSWLSFDMKDQINIKMNSGMQQEIF